MCVLALVCFKNLIWSKGSVHVVRESPLVETKKVQVYQHLVAEAVEIDTPDDRDRHH